MIFKTVVFGCYLSLLSGFKIASIRNSAFEDRLREVELRFVVKSANSRRSLLFILEQGRLSHKKTTDGHIHFTLIIDGQKLPRTLLMERNVHAIQFLESGVIQFDGDLSAFNHFLNTLVEMRQSLVKGKERA